MKYNVFLKNAFIPYPTVPNYKCKTLEEVNEILDNEDTFTDYIIMGTDENGKVYVSSGKIDRPLVKKLIKKS